MIKQVSVSVSWLPKEKGGRTKLPDGHQYLTVAKFNEDGPEWIHNAWSVKILFDTSPSSQGNPSIGTASFIAENAPEERLFSGQNFELFEGPKKVATVKVLSDG